MVVDKFVIVMTIVCCNELHLRLLLFPNTQIIVRINQQKLDRIKKIEWFRIDKIKIK